MSHEKSKRIAVQQKERAPIHLTVRGKVAAFVVAASAVGGAGYGIHETNKVEFSEQTHTKVVSPDETLWDMANSVDNVEGHKPEAVRKMKELSPDLRDGSADVGDEVVIPNSVE